MALRYELCFKCGSETGRAGPGDDSIYGEDGEGPYCEECLEKAKCQEPAAGPGEV